jgi:hypothetical protein
MAKIEPGFYWARWEDGTPRWEPVEVAPSEHNDELRVYMAGSHRETELREWTFGPRLEPPEEET